MGALLSYGADLNVVCRLERGDEEEDEECEEEDEEERAGRSVILKVIRYLSENVTTGTPVLSLSPLGLSAFAYSGQ